MRIPIMKPRLATWVEIGPFLRKMDQNQVYSNHGPLVRELEESYSKYLRVNRDLVVALGNATQAIQGLVSISKNKDWIVPDYTFSATGLAVLNSKRNLHICDVNLVDWKVNVDLISGTQKKYGIIPVMPFGSQIDFSPYKEFEDVIIDAAASLGATLPVFSEMGPSWAIVYSLHATKVLGAGEGAIVICGNVDQANLLRAWSNFGFCSDRTSEIQGTNAKMSDVCSAYGLHSLVNIEIERKEWLTSQGYVTSQASQFHWSTFVNLRPQFHPYWIASFKDEEEKRIVATRLYREGIQSREWWAKPLTLQNAYKDSNSLSPSQNAKSLSATHLGLPMFRGISSNVVSEICTLIELELKKR